ncbi:MAG: DNA-3-methyladenine glycosylase [Nitriliruptoraceae bacterium]
MRAVLERDAVDAAPGLLGMHLWRRTESGLVRARVVEVEAYTPDDPASHSARGRTAANASMFAAAGTAYVYRSYGIHWCLNVVVDAADHGAAVLLRAARLEEGHDQVRRRRPAARSDRDLLRGPGRLTAGLDIDGPRHDGTDLLDTTGSLYLEVDDDWPLAAGEISRGPRVGVARAADVAWRWWQSESPYVSVYRRSPRA